MMEMSMVAEGYYAAKKRYKLNQRMVPNTIIDAVHSILYDKMPKPFKKIDR
jgi:glycerol-3-phosphate dehydrogenase (NAD(P)+)